MGLKGNKGDTGAVGLKGEAGKFGPRGLDGEKGQKGDPASTADVIKTLSRPTFPSINFLSDQSINLTSVKIDGKMTLNGKWIVSKHSKKSLWKGASSLLLEYCVEDDIGKSAWKLEFTSSSDSKINAPKVLFGPVRGDAKSNGLKTHIGQIFVPVSKEGHLYFKFSCSQKVDIKLQRLRVVGFI